MNLHTRQNSLRTCSTLTVLLIALAGCSPNDSPSPRAGSSTSASAVEPRETWDVVSLGGQRAGYTHTRISPEKRGADNLLRVQHEEVVTMVRYGAEIHTVMSFESLEMPDGRLIEFTSDFPQGGTPLKTSGRVVGDQLQLEVSTSGKSVKSTMPWNAERGGPFRLNSSLKARPLRPGDTRTIRSLDAGSNQIATTELSAVDFEQTELLTESRRLLRIDTTTTIAGQQLGGSIWCDAQGEILKTHLDLLDFTAIRATKDQALKEITQITFDLGRQSAVPVARPLPNAHDTSQVVYRVRLKHADPSTTFASGRSQSVVSEDEYTAKITVHALRPGATTGNAQAEPKPSGPGDLNPNSLIQSDNAAVVAMADEAASDLSADAKTPWRTAVALEQFVNRRMTAEGISTAFATAAEVADTLTGDCTEHAVLLAALARARGIPTRVAIGLVHYRGQFLYHMWNEVYIDGVWIPLDATLGRGGIGAAHLKITDSDLDGTSPQAAFLPVVQVIGQMEIEILDVQ